MSVNPLELRRALTGEAPSLKHCVCTAFEHYIERIGKPPAPMLADYAEAITRDQVWVATWEKQVAGVLILTVEGDRLRVDTIAVAPDCQGRGVGGALLELADAEARAQGYAELHLYTNERMAENIAWYGRSGWHETHRALHEGYRRVFMRKTLD